jgi:hypothetical protein
MEGRIHGSELSEKQLSEQRESFRPYPGRSPDVFKWEDIMREEESITLMLGMYVDEGFQHSLAGKNDYSCRILFDFLLDPGNRVVYSI